MESWFIIDFEIVLANECGWEILNDKKERTLKKKK